MTAFYIVKNWERFQHYKDRSPPWIKLHFEILASADWVMLADASKLLMVVCMMIASRNEGRVPNNPNYLQRVAYLNKLPDFTPLIECGFLLNTLADASGCKQTQANARPEVEVQEADTEKKEKEKTIKKENPKPVTYPQEFERFWLAYPAPRRKEKPSACAAWKDACCKTTPENLMDSLLAYAGSEEVTAGWAPYPAKWLKQERWNENFTEQTHGTPLNRHSQTAKPTWASEGQRLAAKYRQNAERQEQSALSGDAEPDLRLAEAIRENAS